MRNIILLTFTLILSNHSFAAELSIENIRSDFRETIDHYNYDLTNGEQLVNQEPLRVREKVASEVISAKKEEILNLEDEFSDLRSDEINLRAAGNEKLSPKRIRSK